MVVVVVVYGSDFIKPLKNCYGLKLPECLLQLKNKFIVLLIIIFGTLRFLWLKSHRAVIQHSGEKMQLARFLIFYKVS